MNKSFLLKISLSGIVLLASAELGAQTSTEEFLHRVAERSFYVEAGRAEADARIAGTRSGQVDDPEVEYGYMPGIEETEGRRMSYGISQQFAWPGEYAARSKYYKLEREQAETEFRAGRQEFLLRVKLLCYEIVHAQKRQALLDWQYTHAGQAAELTQKRLSLGEATALDANNARLSLSAIHTQWLEGATSLEIMHKQLALLAGFADFDTHAFAYAEYPDENIDDLLAQAQAADLFVRTAQLESDKSRRNVSIVRGASMPSFRVGVAGERITATDSFLGVTAGVSIPLWGGSGSVKIARAQHVATELRTQTLRADIESELVELAANARQLRENLVQYDSLRDVQESKTLLYKSFEQKHISVLDYITNLSFLSQIEQEYLGLELKLYRTLAELTKFRL